MGFFRVASCSNTEVNTIWVPSLGTQEIDSIPIYNKALGSHPLRFSYGLHAFPRAAHCVEADMNA
ncbi:protein of unknown function [Hyphomicrobium sp. 1Nfss2.1]